MMGAQQSNLLAQQVREQLAAANAFWLYDGLPRREAPHALLTSGKHSDGYVNVGGVLKEWPDTIKLFGMNLHLFLSQRWPKYFDWVVGADTSSTLLAKDIAARAGARHIRMIKTEDEQGKRQVWDPGNQPLKPWQTILHIEELITTTSSALQVREGIRRANPGVRVVNFVPFLPVVVERSDPDKRITQVEGSIILPLFQLDIRNYNPDACPYCAAGSEALKPKEGDNWAKLTGKAQ